MSDDSEAIVALQTSLAIHRQTLAALETQSDQFGQVIPDPLQQHLDETRRAIAQITSALQRLGALSEQAPAPAVPEAATPKAAAPPAQHAPGLLHRLRAPATPSADYQIEDLLQTADWLRDLGDPAASAPELLSRVYQQLLALMSNSTVPVTLRVQAGFRLGHLGDPRFQNLRPPVIFISGGPCRVGRQGGYEDEGPPQWIDVPPFAIGVYPVTNQEYARYLVEVPTAERPRYWNDPRFNNPSQPVVGVTWHAAVAYCDWLTARLSATGQIAREMVVRLPLEAEWEKAAGWDPAAQAQRRYPWGDEWSATRANTAEERGSWVTAPVGCYANGVSAYGMHDAIGNVWEWTASEYASYAGAAKPFREAGSYAIRGSSCMMLSSHARCTYRSRLPATYWRYHLGFRVVIGRPLGAHSTDLLARRATDI